MTTPTQGEHAQTAAQVQRYKIGYPTDSWGERSSTPSGIPDHAGAWVRYEDHAAQVAALTAAQPASPQGVAEVNWWEADGDKYDASISPMQPAQGVAYAASSFLEIPDVQDESGINTHYSRELVLECIDAALRTQQPAPADRIDLHQALADPENQPNQYGVQFLMHGPKMAFKIGNRQFCLDYEPTEPGEFEFMRDALIDAFSTFTPDVKIALGAQQPAPATQQAEEVPHEKLTRKIDLILTDQASDLSPGAIRALQWMRTWVNVPLCLAAPKPPTAQAAPAAGAVAVPRETLVAWRQWCAQSMSHAIEHEISDWLTAAPTPAAQADSQPAPVLGYPPLPHELTRTDRGHLIQRFRVEALMRAYVDADRAARKQGGA